MSVAVTIPDPKQDALTAPVIVKTPPSQSGSNSQRSRQRFLSVWPRLRGELEDLMVKHNMPKDAQDWFKNVWLQPNSSSTLPATCG